MKNCGDLLMKRNEMRMARARARAIRKRNKKRELQSRISMLSVGAVILLCVLCMFMISGGSARENKKGIPIVIKTKDVEIFQGEEKPEFTSEIYCDGDPHLVLNDKSGYTLQNLIDDLKRGSGYTLECKADGTKEGKFPIHVQLNSEITTPLYAEWFGKVRIDVEEGTFKVKNHYGEMKGNKFRLWDGNYASDQFITSKGKTYYFDKSGEKLTGWNVIGGSKYLFDKEGVMKTGWKKAKDATYYFAENGVMTVGWLKLDDNKYYFDQDGKMLTGEQKLGNRTCVFDEKGILVSEEGGVDPEKPMVALTFDDGPGPRTEELLNVLEANDAHATFFMLGTKASQYESTVKKMAELGNELGNHSWDHKNLALLEPDAIVKQMEDTNAAVVKASGQRPTVMRPPYGSVNSTVRENANMPLIMWSIDTEDWKTRNAQTTINVVMNNVHDGDIILMHDIHSQSVDAAIQLIPMLKEKGFQIVTVSEMAEAREINMEKGAKYFNFRK